MADRVAVFSDGKIVQAGSPAEVYGSPRTKFVADFVGSSNILSPDLMARISGQRRWASLRPEQVSLAGKAAKDGLEATLVAAHYLGSTTRFVTEAGGQRIAGMLEAGVAVPEIGSSVHLAFDRSDLHILEDAV